MSRRTKTALVVFSVIFLATFALAMYEAYVPGSTKEVFGSVVALRQIANNSQPDIRRYVAVKLDNGHTIQARVSSIWSSNSSSWQPGCFRTEHYSIDRL
jgi:hypothetical protein